MNKSLLSMRKKTQHSSSKLTLISLSSFSDKTREMAILKGEEAAKNIVNDLKLFIEKIIELIY